MPNKIYAQFEGNNIKPPKGWKILEEGLEIPHVHVECIAGYEQKPVWAAPRRCHSTMTPFTARISGSVIAFAIQI